MTTIATRFHAALALALAIAASSASAQVAPNYQQNGHLLDKNPQVGGGGTNSPVTGYVPANAADITGGNVTGLGAFHGNVPYRSQYEFGSVPGESAVTRFDRQSGGVPANGGPYIGIPQPYYSPANIVSTGGGSINPGNARNPALGSGVEAQIQGPGGYRSPGSQVTLQPSGAVTGQPEHYIGASPDIAPNPFQPSDANVSYLYGVVDPRAQAPENRYQIPPRPATNNPATQPANAIQGNATQPRTDIGVNEVRDGSTQVQIGAAPQDNRLRGSIPSQLVGQTNADLVVSDEYKDILVTLQKNREAEEARQAALAAANTKPDTTKGPEFVIDPFTGQLRVRGADEKNPLIAGAATRPAGAPNAARTTDATAALKAAHTMPPLQTLAGKTPTPFNTLMAGAEIRLKKGQFFEAADLYQQAMLEQPANMLPIIGRAHAELAAGMYESAAYDLKFVFKHKPEMTGLRHDIRSEIPADRLAFLSADLKSLTDKSSETAWFLSAYLGYQLGEKDLETTLNNWTDKMPTDAWPSAMRSAFLDTKPETQPAAK